MVESRLARRRTSPVPGLRAAAGPAAGGGQKFDRKGGQNGRISFGPSGGEEVLASRRERFAEDLFDQRSNKIWVRIGRKSGRVRGRAAAPPWAPGPCADRATEHRSKSGQIVVKKRSNAGPDGGPAEVRSGVVEMVKMPWKYARTERSDRARRRGAARDPFWQPIFGGQKMRAGKKKNAGGGGEPS